MNKISKFQKFQAVNINRDQIRNAPYNPRKIGENEAKELRKALKKFGLVETLVWNKRTGNLVGGHQRLAQIDDLEGKKEYQLTVSQIDVDEKSEKEINLLLNNPNLQGEYDEEALAKLVGEIDFKNAGFTQADLDIMGIDIDLKKFDEDDGQGTEDLAAKIAAVKEVKAASKEKSRNQQENFIVLTFSDNNEREKMLELFGMEKDDRYLKGETVLKAVLSAAK